MGMEAPFALERSCCEASGTGNARKLECDYINFWGMSQAGSRLLPTKLQRVQHKKTVRPAG
ncbi:hypothetical protein DAETH_29200 [Deinococcus aetherius]|uniref:Uncharacterized protein n=1 Tax=Deinococcus aetherius TaxID=200252 RepID=A0ABN6RKY7_9DEIO|nr:hypothetical protein DAETH_29200 [Deinococcus aetherius]